MELAYPSDQSPIQLSLQVVVAVKKSAFFLAEVLGFTLLIQAVGALLFGLQMNGIPAQLGLWFLFGLAILLLAWIFNKVLRGQGIRELGFRYHKSLSADLWWGVCGFAVLNLLSLPLDIAALRNQEDMAHAVVTQLHLSSPLQILVGGSLMAVALGFFTGAFHEEIRFRGYYQGAGSNELTPLAGFLLALIPFSLGHYYAQPGWSLVQVLATVIPAIVYGLLYHATRSLIVVMTAHTLTNVLPIFRVLLNEVTRSRSVTLSALVALALLCLLLIILRWKHELQEWRSLMRGLFVVKPLFGAVVGGFIGLALLAIWPHRLPPAYSAIVGAALFGVALLGKSLKAK
jgi:membrane protease YdiL (CAAX protease family)